jgi:A/G-specific adenine glycosylase
MLPKTKQVLAAKAQRHMPENAPSDYNQALMELGALVCLPGTPKCEECPLREQCAGFAIDIAHTLPRKAAKPPKKQVPVCIFVVHSPRGMLLQQRPAKGLLARLWQPPLFEGSFTKAQARQKLGQLLPGVVLGEKLPTAAHVFTHRIWQLYGWQAVTDANLAAPKGCVWATPQMLQNQYAVPSAFAAYRPMMNAGGREE